jgi:hypothetical protein
MLFVGAQMIKKVTLYSSETVYVAILERAKEIKFIFSILKDIGGEVKL